MTEERRRQLWDESIRLENELREATRELLHEIRAPLQNRDCTPKTPEEREAYEKSVGSAKAVAEKLWLRFGEIAYEVRGEDDDA